MLYGESYIQRALELYKEHTAQEVFQILIKEHPDKPHPSERTLGRWKRARKEQRAIFESRVTAISKEEHRARMVEIAKMLLDNDVGKVVVVGDGKQPQDTYVIVYPMPGFEEIPHNRLVGRIEGNIDKACKKYGSWDIFDCFAPHLMSEFPSRQDYNELLNKYPGKMINALRTLAQRKTFKGTCPVCKDW